MSNKPSIPKVPSSPDNARMSFDKAVKERLELVCGDRAGKIKSLAPDASLAVAVAKINEILSALQ